MLPKESLRFFYLDPSWIASLVDGALSIGRVNRGHDNAVHKQALMDTDTVQSQEIVSGFLLHSSVVKGWPNLQVNAYDYTFPTDANTAEQAKDDPIPATSDSELKCLRMERLSDSILLALFQGDVKVLDIHEKPETVHFGLDATGSSQPGEAYDKAPLQANGEPYDPPLQPTGDHDYYLEDSRVIKPLTLVKGLETLDLGYPKPLTSAQFALSMIEGVSKVRFIAS